ncbi:MAG: 6-carboxytetrahydropterin synthase [Ignavibacteriae bacterium]|nr:6-carboxytetrahydropterin synthase [Ignavibacteriota bacterium]
MIYITRKEHFSASHRLNNPKIGKKENEAIFGKCNEFHGHNYYLEVTLCGEPEQNSGYVFDLKKLSRIISKEILQKVDHKYLNEVEMFKGINPTTENMAGIFWKILNPKLKTKNARLYSVKIYETEKNIIEYRD